MALAFLLYVGKLAIKLVNYMCGCLLSLDHRRVETNQHTVPYKTEKPPKSLCHKHLDENRSCPESQVLM